MLGEPNHDRAALLKRLAETQAEVENLALNLADCIEARDYHAERLGVRLRQLDAMRRALEEALPFVKHADSRWDQARVAEVHRQIVEALALGDT